MQVVDFAKFGAIELLDWATLFNDLYPTKVFGFLAFFAGGRLLFSVLILWEPAETDRLALFADLHIELAPPLSWEYFFCPHF